MCTRHRFPSFRDASVVSDTLRHFRRAAESEGFAILAYCFMPDHAHLLVEGLFDTSNLRRFTKRAKQHSGAAYALRHGTPLWQEGYYDRVLRKDNDAREVARYILWNPVRAGIVDAPVSYPFLGSDVWRVDDLLK